MVLHFKSLMLHFIGFIKNPNAPDYVDISKDQKLVNVCFYYLFITFGVSVIILGLPAAIAEKLGLFDELKESDLKDGGSDQNCRGGRFCPAYGRSAV